MSGKGYKPPTRAELQAMRDAKLTAQADPAAEARRREKGFLQSLTNAREDFEWLIANQGWALLGFATFTEWYVERVQPTLAALGGRPAPELADHVLKRIREDEESLPKPQRRTVKELTELVGASEWKVRNRQDRRERRSSPSADLDSETAATEVGVPPVAAPTAVDDAPCTSTSTDGDEGFHSPDDSPAGDGPGAERPVPGNPQDTPAAAVDQVALVAQQSGLHHPEPDPGGPVERNAPGGPSSFIEGSSDGDGEEEGPAIPQEGSSSDPSTVVAMFAGWVDIVDRLDPQALGPLLTDEQLAALFDHSDDIAQFVGLLERWRTP